MIQEQANELLRRGNVTAEEARDLVEVQRNGLVIEMRKPLTPFGKLYSEVLKPANSLPTFEALVERKGTVEAVLVSVGKTRAVTNRIAFIGRTAGTAGFVLEIVAVAVVIELAPEDQRARVATEEVSGAVGGIAAGTGGCWAGRLDWQQTGQGGRAPPVAPAAYRVEDEIGRSCWTGSTDGSSTAFHPAGLRRAWCGCRSGACTTVAARLTA